MPLRRIIKNVVKNYSDAQVKVREATSNDPWGPSSTLMTEIADLTYNVLAFTEIMQMLWKRLNDHGRNWRHVYKALVLLEYIIKTGSEKVAQQCREKIYAIQTLKDFQYVEETRDYGQNIREKARQLTTLLKDSERLKNERAKALKAKEKFAQNSAGVPMGPNFASTSPALPNILSYPEHSTGRYSGFGSPSSWSLEGNGSSALPLDVELEAVRPTSSGEEQLQLELAMAISKVEHEQQLKALKGDEVKLQMALKQSKIETTKPQSSTLPAATADPWDTRGGCLDGDDSHFETTSPWLETAHSSAAWPGVGGQVNGENTAVAEASFKTVFQPFLDDEFEEFSSMRGKKQRQPFDDFPAPGLDTAFKDLSFNEASIATPVSLIDQNCTSNQQPPSYSSSSSSKTPRGKSPKDFLGENAALVNLDNLMCPEKPAPLFPLAHSPSSASPLRDNSSTSCLNPFFPTPSQGVTSSMSRQHEKGPSFLCNVSNFLVSASSSPIHQPVSQPLSTTTTHHTLPMVSTTTTQPTPLPATYPTEFNPFL